MSKTSTLKYLNIAEMKPNTTEKLCPVCKKQNDENAKVCRHCGARLGELSTGYVAVPESSVYAPAGQMESFIEIDSIPAEGIGIQVAGETKPLYVPIDWELIIGRKMEASSTQELINIKMKGKPDSEAFLDLSEMHAGTMGVSRRHVMIRRTISGYEVTDLSSRNGTWLNGQRLVPNRAYSLSSGSSLRIGNMRLLIMYHPKR